MGEIRESEKRRFCYTVRRRGSLNEIPPNFLCSLYFQHSSMDQEIVVHQLFFFSPLFACKNVTRRPIVCVTRFLLVAS